MNICITINAILGDSLPLHTKLHAIYIVRNLNDKKVSLQWLCTKSNIPSKGLLGDFFQGRRPLPRKYLHGLTTALGLTEEQTALILLWADEKIVSEAELPKIQERITSILDTLRN